MTFKIKILFSSWPNILCFLLIITASPAIVKAQLEEGWKFVSQREPISPISYIDDRITFHQEPTLAISGNGKAYANGCWYRNEEVSPGKYVHFNIYFKTEKVNEPDRCILARIIWHDALGNLVNQAEYPATRRERSPEGWNVIDQTYQVPEKAVTARVELVYRWDADGKVNFGGYTFQYSDPVKSRLVRLATIYHEPHNSSGPEENLKQFAELIGQAALKHADIVCLPESITLVGTGLDYVSASEPVPGPTTEFLGELARKHHLYIVAGILEKDEALVYNTAVLINRQGELAGKYHKVCLPREEIEGGVTPGNSLPVFETDFGRIGMIICWDVTFPETARALARKGAEVILMPIWGGNLVLARARAIENQIYLVSSSYNMKTAVFDKEGKILQEANEKEPVVVTEVDLNQHKLWPWLGDLKNRIPREMPATEALK